MKTFRRLILSFTLLSFAVLGFSSCNTYEDGGNTEMFTETFTVNAWNSSSVDRWVWNDDYKRWQCVLRWDVIDSYILNYGTVIAGVYIREYEGNNSYLTIKNMPFIEAVDPAYNVTRLIGYDISESYIMVYIQASDLSYEPSDALRYDFKVNVFWER